MLPPGLFRQIVEEIQISVLQRWHGLYRITGRFYVLNDANLHAVIFRPDIAYNSLVLIVHELFSRHLRQPDPAIHHFDIFIASVDVLDVAILHHHNLRGNLLHIGYNMGGKQHQTIFRISGDDVAEFDPLITLVIGRFQNGKQEKAVQMYR